MKNYVLLFFILIGVVVLPFACVYYNKELGVRTENARNEIYKESTTYNDSMIRELYDLRFEYLKANPEQKQALVSILRHKFSVYPAEKIPNELKEFYYQIMNGEL